ncbi:MAG TPA: flagellar brake domain-containing protein [Bacilli bacterium]|nr:flagellar brake domain-containing protein [Bacilli bacterium]
MIGQTVHLEVTDGYFTGKYTAKLQDMEKTRLFIDMPFKPNAASPTRIDDGVEVLVRYRSADGTQCSFYANVMGREVRNIPLLSLSRPKLSEIHRQQRREFLRVPLSVPIDIVYMDSETKQIVSCATYGSDISGGGLAFRIKREYNIRANDIIGFNFTMPLEGKKYPITGKGRVIRVGQTDEQSGMKVISLKYFEINESDRQRIVQYTFKAQISMRDKGVLNS